MGESSDERANRDRIAELWNSCSDAYFGKRDTPSILHRIRQDPAMVFHRDVYPDLRNAIAKGRRKVCVLASGDNQAVFALHFLGADVTSIDISERQIANAQSIAESNGLRIDFVVSDVQSLDPIADESFDLVYTSNGVLTWVDDLVQMFREAWRILVKGGIYVLYDVHPIQRPWDDDFARATLIKPYHDVGPIQDPRNKDARTFHWRTEDIVNALTAAGFRIQRLNELAGGETKESGYFWGDEVNSDLNDWRTNPLAGLPAWLEIVSGKD